MKCPACSEQIRVPTIEEVQAALELRRKGKSQGGVGTKAESRSDDETVRKPLPSEVRQDPDDTLRTSTPASKGDVDGDHTAIQSRPEQMDEVTRELWSHTGEIRDPWLDEEADQEEEFHINKRGLDESGLDMTPMVDVTFLLLIFFMITAAFSIQKSMQAEPPEPEDEGAAPDTDDRRARRGVDHCRHLG